MAITYNSAINISLCEQMLASELVPQAIEEALYKQGMDAATVVEHLKEIKRMRNAKKQISGIICMGIGAFLGFLSCLLTITQAIPHMHDFIFYGLTMIAIVVVVIGLYLVFE